MFIRFVEKGIDIRKTSYLTGDNIFPGLLSELQNNLRLQLENPYERTCTTDIMWYDVDQNLQNSISIGRSFGFQWMDGSPIELGSSNNGLIIVIDFSLYHDKQFYAFNHVMDEQLSKFKKLNSFELFTYHACTYVDFQGYSRGGREYAIDFGSDAEGASVLISEILSQVKNLSPTDSYDIFTNVSEAAVLQARNNWYNSHGFNANSGCLGVIAAFIIFASAALCSLVG